jgi:hypothetical protein
VAGSTEQTYGHFGSITGEHSRVAEWLLASEDGLCYVKLVNCHLTFHVNENSTFYLDYYCFCFLNSAYYLILACSIVPVSTCSEKHFFLLHIYEYIYLVFSFSNFYCCWVLTCLCFNMHY